MVVDEKCYEVLVAFDYKNSEDIELNCIEVTIAGIGINILPMLNEKQKQKVIDNLDYERL